ncbi:hypothetical protein L0Y65_03420 [Candidatus Micrarchaeota archaeon]|nr:hypothetical protein [Candidatus Micrarchaeota archaeon]
MVLTARDLARLIELNKKKAELQFQASVLGVTPDGELRRVSVNAEELSERAKAAGIRLVFPNQDRLDELASALEEFPPDAIRAGIKVRDGKAYQTLKDRGMIVKKNFENRAEIAKLLIIIARMSEEERNEALRAIAAGALDKPLSATSIDECTRAKLARFLRRCGIMCALSGSGLLPSGEGLEGDKEIRIEMQNRCVWVAESARGRLEENLKKMQNLNARIQLKNAERQIKVFSEEEENVFATLQKEYLDLLKEQDEVLREFNEEDGLASRI